MTQPLLPQLSTTPEKIARLDSRERLRVLNFLLRWEAAAEALDCLDHIDVTQMVSLQDQRARALEDVGRAPEAITLMEARIRQKDSDTARTQLGRHHLAAGNTERALAIANELVSAAEVSGTSWSFVGDVQLARGDLKAAEAAFLQHQQMAPNSRQPQLGLMRIHHRLGDPVRASAYAVRAFTVLEGEYELPIPALRDLRDFFAQTSDENRLRTAEEQLAQRFGLELGEIQTLLETEATGRPPRPAATSTRRQPTLSARPKSAPFVTDLEAIPVSENERTTLHDHVQRLFGFSELRPAQAEIMACARRSEHVLAILPTGAGKSLCYQLPALIDQGVTLVISPLIALMKDQVDGLPLDLRQRAISINSSMSGSALQEAIGQLASGRYKLIYAAPERLRQRPFVHALRQAGLARLVIDEAHCVSVWGHDFRPDYLRLAQAHRDLGSPPILALTATAPPRVRQDIERQLFGKSTLIPALPESGRESLNTAAETDLAIRQEPFQAQQKAQPSTLRVIATDIYRPNLHLHVIKARGEDEKLQHLLQIGRGLKGCGIIYARTRSNCEELATLLRRYGVNADAYHAGLANRADVQERFMRGKIQVIVATVAFGMGVDKSDIRFIIHYGLPDSVEAYYQEIGRAGRDGQPADCVLLWSTSDKATLTRHANEGLLTKEYLRDVFTAVRARMAGQTMGSIAFDDLHRDLHSTDETALRVALSVLEQAGLITRHDDAPRSVSLQVLTGVMDGSASSEVSVSAPSQLGGGQGWGGFLTAARLRPQQIVNRSFTELATVVEIPLDRLEAQLLEWQEQGLLRINPSDRDLLITLHVAPVDTKQRIDSLLDQFATVQRQRVTEMGDYATDTHCRHGYLANYLGGLPRESCEVCDNCGVALLTEETAAMLSDEEQAKTVLRALNEQKWGKVNLVAVLRGDLSVGERGQKSSVFGALTFRSETALGKLVDRLIGDGLIRSVGLSHGGVALELSHDGRDVLSGKKPFKTLD